MPKQKGEMWRNFSIDSILKRNVNTENSQYGSQNFIKHLDYELQSNKKFNLSRLKSKFIIQNLEQISDPTEILRTFSKNNR